MDGIQAGYFPFLAVGLSRDGLSLRTIRAFGSDAPLRLYCRGIEVGRCRLDGPLREGAVIDIPVERLPRVPLPAELRLATAPDGPDLAAPWRIDSAEAALSLLGPPDMRIEDLRLDHGVLRGTGREARNGLLDPVLYARINGAGARIVAADPPIALPEGGCAFRFAMPILPADLTEAGLSVTLMLVGQDAPAGSFAWGRSGVGEAERRLAELEGRIRQMEDEAAAAQQALQATLQRQLALQQERIDAFVVAAATPAAGPAGRRPGPRAGCAAGAAGDRRAGPGRRSGPGPDRAAARGAARGRRCSAPAGTARRSTQAAASAGWDRAACC
ncbi:hypothetical protein [Dankookia sp. P2]|uniref:hypothetical protein n=1 Tax=Dankookia sp. P2 TaxID=3423955 RepID=UPI003D67F70A